MTIEMMKDLNPPMHVHGFGEQAKPFLAARSPDRRVNKDRKLGAVRLPFLGGPRPFPLSM